MSIPQIIKDIGGCYIYPYSTLEKQKILVKDYYLIRNPNHNTTIKLPTDKKNNEKYFYNIYIYI
jgi:hypothetical protein